MHLTNSCNACCCAGHYTKHDRKTPCDTPTGARCCFYSPAQCCPHATTHPNIPKTSAESAPSSIPLTPPPTSSTPACVLPPLLAATSNSMVPFLLAFWFSKLDPAEAGSSSLSAARLIPRAAAAPMSAGAAASCRCSETPRFSSSSCCNRSSSYFEMLREGRWCDGLKQKGCKRWGWSEAWGMVWFVRCGWHGGAMGGSATPTAPPSGV